MNAWTKSRGLAIVLAIFLGGFGVHWFYLERPGRGLLYLLFFWTGLPALAALVELVYWALMNEHRWHERYESHHHVGG